MSSNRGKTALVVGFAVATLVFASAAGAQQGRVVEQKAKPQQSSVVEVAPVAEQKIVEIKASPQVIVELQEVQEEQERAQAQLRQAYRIAQEFNVRPRVRLSGFGLRGGNIATRALASAEDLALSETQEQSIRDAQRSHRRDGIRRGADIEIAELELEEMMEADVLDLVTIESHMRQIANLQVDERMANLRTDRAVRDLLTAEQVEKLDEQAGQFMFGTVRRERSR